MSKTRIIEADVTNEHLSITHIKQSKIRGLDCSYVVSEELKVAIIDTIFQVEEYGRYDERFDSMVELNILKDVIVMLPYLGLDKIIDSQIAFKDIEITLYNFWENNTISFVYLKDSD